MATDGVFVFAGGGTGGHLFPGIAVATALRRLRPDAGVLFLCTPRGLDAELLAPAGFEHLPQRVRPLPRQPWNWPGFLYHWYAAVADAARVIRGRRVSAVLGLGGYAAGPAVVAARRAGVPTAILNPDAIPGRANLRLARDADLVVAQWECSKRCFPPGTDCRALGCPIRVEFAELPAQHARARLGLDPQRPTLVVTGASQGARTVNQAMSAVWPELRADYPDWQLLHLSGATDEAATRDAYARCGAPATVVAFTHEMHVALSAADLVVSRAGASTLAELTLLGRPSVLLPYPYHKDRHQHANGQVLADAGAAVLLEDRKDADLNRDPLRAALAPLMGDPARRERMAQAARTLARPDAAARVADWLSQHAPSTARSA